MTEGRLTTEERKALDAILVALWQCETESGYEHMRAKVESFLARREREAAARVLREAAEAAIDCEHTQDMAWCRACDDWVHHLRALVARVTAGDQEDA